MSPGKAISCGDVVQCRHGGPKMTVESVTMAEWVNCVWFGPDLGLTRGQIHATALRVIKLAAGKRPRGRPKKPSVLTAAERQRRYRARKRGERG